MLFLIIVAFLIVLLAYIVYCENGHHNVLVYPFPIPTSTPNPIQIHYHRPFKKNKKISLSPSVNGTPTANTNGVTERQPTANKITLSPSVSSVNGVD